MKANELIIGDWVYRPDCYDRVKEIRTNSILGSDHLRGTIPLTQIGPIPLTPEILEKNGFVKGNMGIMWHESEFYLTKIKSFYIPFRLERIHITYVHELQHALRLCGLTELADNFQI